MESRRERERESTDSEATAVTNALTCTATNSEIDSDANPKPHQRQRTTPLPKMQKPHPQPSAGNLPLYPPQPTAPFPRVFRAPGRPTASTPPQPIGSRLSIALRPPLHRGAGGRETSGRERSASWSLAGRAGRVRMMRAGGRCGECARSRLVHWVVSHCGH